MAPVAGLLVTFLAVAAHLTLAHAARKPSNAVLLSSVKSLTFYDGKKTTGRRLDPIPQLTCTGGSGEHYYKPEVVRCVNAGSSYSSEDIDWTCTATLPIEFKLGSTEVVCEGYDSAEDDHVLKGSCALEYRLILTDAGEQKYGTPSRWNFGSTTSESKGGSPSSAVPLLFWALFLAVAAWMIYLAFFRGRTNGNIPRRGWNGGGGGGGGGGFDDPPPPYSPYDKKPSSSSTRYARQPPRPRAAPAAEAQGWRPGFWTGAATGAAGAWLAGRGAARQQAPQMRQQPASSWFGSSRDAADEGPSNSRTAGTSTFSSQRHTSTGFGGTRRR